MARLAGKTVLVTGGTSGIGLATARKCLAEGARVAITGTSEDKLAAATRDLDGEILTIKSDAGDVGGQAAVIDAVHRAFGEIGAIVINAGMADFRPIEGFDPAAFDRSFAVNVKGPFFLIQAALPVLANPAAIVFNGSINARIGMPNSSLYSATKAALISMARTFSGELVGRGVRVNVVSPGPVATPLYDKLGFSAADLKGMQDGLTDQIPIHRFGEPDEIADAFVYLISDESAYVVGSELIIDGGMSNL